MHLRRKIDNLCVMHVYGADQTDSDGTSLPLNFRHDAIKMRYENELVSSVTYLFDQRQKYRR